MFLSVAHCALTDDRRLKVNEDSARHVLSGTCLAEESVEGVVSPSDGLVGGHLTVGLDAMLQTVQLPACIADLHSGLTHVNTQTFSL